MIANPKHIAFSCLLLGAITLAGCHNRETGKVVTTTQTPKEDTEQPYIEGNKEIMRLEQEEMELFIKRYGWEMQRSGTGLYYQILDPGHGELFHEGETVTLKYLTFLLNGERVYDSESNGVKTFKVARSEEIVALHEMATLLRPGAKARLVIPSHLAYGVTGDGNKINGRMPIAMIVETMNEERGESKN